MKTLNLNSIIKTHNKLFKAATKAEKRVLIAKDVLKMLSNKKIIAGRGIFTNVFEFDPELGGESFQTLLLGKDKVKCECCALGGLMTSCIGYVNDMTLDESHSELKWSGGTSIAARKLQNFFSFEQLKLIEQAFEEGQGYYFSQPNKKAVSFAENLNPTAALKKIMKNIIENNGTFVP